MNLHIYLTVIVVAVFVMLLFVIGKLNQLNTQLEKRTKESNNNFLDLHKTPNWYIYLLLAIAIIVIVFAFCAPYIYTNISGLKESKDTGAMGDTVGGLMNPYIALAGVIVTGLAFLMQYEANAQQRKLFLIEQDENKAQLQVQITRQDKERKLQQFESQFYEMIRLHRENVSEMEISGYDFEESPIKDSSMKKFPVVTSGRKVFVTMKTELESILLAYKIQHKLDTDGFRMCYDIFFSGLDRFSTKYGTFNVFGMRMRVASSTHQFPDRFKKYKNHERKERIAGAKLNFNYKPFSGHASRLGHYFRHLYLTVKLVVYSDALNNDEERMNYLRILRAQLSNHEQMLLFYNWLSEHGQKWENEDQHFFAKYNMIHNLWYNELVDDPFIKANVNKIRTLAESLGNYDVYEID